MGNGLKSKENDIEAKVEALLGKMTVEEKVGQLNQLGTSIYDDHIDIQEDMIRKGQVGSYLSVYGADFLNRLQKVAVEESRLGIPLLFGHDVIHGLKTVFPIPLAMACSWEPEVAEKAARTAAAETASTGVRWTFAPMVDIARDPRWGRIAEGYGEDPYLGSRMAEASVRGFQGDDLSAPDSIAACAKHYAAYGAVVGGRDYNTVDMSLQILHEVYLPPFRAAAEAGAATFMSAFNDVNGVPATGNRYLLRDVLKKGWNYDGMVVSDAGAIGELIIHGFAEDRRDAAEKALNAGVDMDMGSCCYKDFVKALVEEGRVPAEFLDDAVRRVLRLKFRLGLFERPYTDTGRAEKTFLLPEFRAAARDAACKSIVLLKNAGGLLPLSKTAKIAVVGPLGNDFTDPLGCWVVDEKEHAVTVLEGIRAATGLEPLFAPGCGITGDDMSGFAEAVEAAKQADIVVAAVGENRDMSGEAHSRADIGLPGAQEELLHALKNTGKPLVVLAMGGRPLALGWEAENADALLAAWHLGIESGSGIADVLFGDFNPSGRLAVTFPYSSEQAPFYYNHPNTGRPASDLIWSCKYIDMPREPLFPFGFGLSYTAFEYGNLEIHTPELPADGVLRVSADVQNTGSREGDEVVQLYVRDRFASRVRPVRELKRFQKLRLAPGETKRVDFEVNAGELGFYDEAMNYIVEPGKFDVFVAHDSSCGLEGEFTING